MKTAFICIVLSVMFSTAGAWWIYPPLGCFVFAGWSMLWGWACHKAHEENKNKSQGPTP